MIVRGLVSALLLCVGFLSGWYSASSSLPKPSSTDYSSVLQLANNNQRVIENFNFLVEPIMGVSISLAKDDPEAIGLLYALLKISDGSNAEGIHILLGTFIRSKTSLFLRTLEKYNNDLTDIEYIVGNLGPKYYDKPTLHSAELDKRVKAIEAVSDPELASIKNRVLSELKQR